MKKSKAREIRKKCEKALESVAEELGMSLTSKGTSYGLTNCQVKFEFSEVHENGVAMTREAQAFKRHASAYGLDPEDLGRTFTTVSGREHKIVGFNTRAKKYPILTEADDGKYKFPAEDVVGYLEQQEQTLDA